MRTAPATPHLGLWPEHLPQLPRVLEGYQTGDLVWLTEGLRRTAARVLIPLRRTHQLVLRTDDHRIVTMNPVTHPHMICKRSIPA